MSADRCYHWAGPSEPTQKTRKEFGEWCPYCEIAELRAENARLLQIIRRAHEETFVGDDAA